MAKAKNNKTYALIQDGKVHQIFTKAELSEWNDELIVIDITGKTVSVGDIWSGTGANFSAPPAPPVLPLSCTPWQMRRALNQLGMRQAVEDAVAASTNQDLKDGWEFASEFREDDDFVVAMAASIGQSENLHGLMVLAASL